jgi:hypothetical protein
MLMVALLAISLPEAEKAIALHEFRAKFTFAQIKRLDEEVEAEIAELESRIPDPESGASAAPSGLSSP